MKGNLRIQQFLKKTQNTDTQSSVNDQKLSN